MKHIARLDPARLDLARLVALSITLTPAAAFGEMQTYYHAGAWDAFSGRSDTGGAVCGVGTTNPSDHRRLSMRFDIGGGDTAFSASKPDWSIPADTHVTVVMQIGLNTPWTMQAAGQDHRIDWTLDPNALRTFDRQFRGAGSMTLTFPDGSEPPWVLSLGGSMVISDTFGRCVRDLTRQVQAAQSQGSGVPPNSAPPPQGPTQPFSAPASTPPALPPPASPSLGAVSPAR
jgi:hypothetical protein